MKDVSEVYFTGRGTDGGAGHDTSGNRFGARSLYRRPKGSEAGGRDRAAQSLAAPARSRRSARGNRPEKYHHDRADGSRQNRNLPPFGKALPSSFYQSRSLQVHRSGLRRPRRRIDHSRLDRPRGQHGQRGREAKGRDQSARSRRRAGAGSLVAGKLSRGRRRRSDRRGNVCNRLGKNSRKCSAKGRWTIVSSISR